MLITPNRGAAKTPKTYKMESRDGSRTAATSKMEHFVIIVNGWKPLTIFTKSSILDVAAVLDPSLESFAGLLYASVKPSTVITITSQYYRYFTEVRKLFVEFSCAYQKQKQPPRGVPRKRCFENMK